MVHPEALSYLRRIQAVPYRGADDRAWCEAVLPLYVEMIEKRIHFAQAAYRDGEFAWITNDPTVVNANGEEYEPELGRLLAETLLHPVGQWCVYFEATDKRRAAADAWLKQHRPPVEWIADRPFGRANIFGLMRPVFEAFRKRDVCVVGPRHLQAIWAHGLLDCGEYIEVAKDGTAWEHADKYAEQVWLADADLFLIAGGSAANLIIHQAWPHVARRATLIDIGAVLDPYAGVFSRNAYRTPEWQRDVMPLNWPDA